MAGEFATKHHICHSHDLPRLSQTSPNGGSNGTKCTSIKLQLQWSTINITKYRTKKSARTYLLCTHISVMIAPADGTAGNIPKNIVTLGLYFCGGPHHVRDVVRISCRRIELLESSICSQLVMFLMFLALNFVNKHEYCSNYHLPICGRPT